MNTKFMKSDYTHTIFFFEMDIKCCDMQFFYYVKLNAI